MDKKAIIKSIVIFLVIGILMKVTEPILGPNNVIVGILAIITSLMLLGKDFTGNPILNFIKLSLIGVGSVVFAYLAQLNPYVGTLITLVWVFILIFLTTFNLKKPIYMGFLITYIMILSTTGTVHDILPRSIVLIVASFAIIVVQLIIRRKKEKNLKHPNTLAALEILEHQLDKIIQGKEFLKDCRDFSECIKSWNTKLVERRQNSFYFTASENTQTSIMASLEILQRDIISINKLYLQDQSYKNILVKLKASIIEIRYYLNKVSDLNKVEEKLVAFTESCKEKQENYIIASLSQDVDILINNIKRRVNPNIQSKDITIDKPNILQLLKLGFDKESLRFTFAIRMSVLMAIAYFIISFGDLRNGRWMLFTIMSVCLPYDSATKEAGIGRIKGTIIGAILIFILFSIIPNEAIRMGIMGVGFYFLMNHKGNLIVKGIGSTILGLSIASMTSTVPTNEFMMTFERIMYTIAGFIIAYLGSKFILNYNIEKETENLIDKYYKINKVNVELLMKENDIYKIVYKLKSSMLLARAIESKIIINNSILKDDNIELFLEESRFIMINIYSTLTRMKYCENPDIVKNTKQKIVDVYKDFDIKQDKSLLERLDINFKLDKETIIYISFANVVEELIYSKRAINKVKLS